MASNSVLYNEPFDKGIPQK